MECFAFQASFEGIWGVSAGPGSTQEGKNAQNHNLGNYLSTVLNSIFFPADPGGGQNGLGARADRGC